MREDRKEVFDVETPAFPYDKMPHPNIRSYFASLTALAAVSCRFGHVRGLLPPTAKEEFKKAIKDYVASWKPVFDDIDEQMFDLAKTWCRFEKFDFLGVETQLYSTIFGLEKFYESCGIRIHRHFQGLSRRSIPQCISDVRHSLSQTPTRSSRKAPLYAASRRLRRVTSGLHL